MFRQCTQTHQQQAVWGRTLTSVALSSLFVGLLMASGLQGTNVSVAQGFGQSATVAAGTATVPGSFAELGERLGPTVVNIQVTKIAPVAGIPGMPEPEGPYGEMFKRFFKDLPQRPEQFRTQGSGSGVIINADGHVLTNNMLCRWPRNSTVTLAVSGYQARVVGRAARQTGGLRSIEALAARGANGQLC